MSIFLKTEDEIDLMRKANQLVGKTLAEVGKHVRPGVTTLQLDNIAEEYIFDNGGVPTFKNFPNPFGESFPASICTSVNNVVVHGIPSDKDVLVDGDIVSVDCGVILDGFNGDCCYTFGVGEISPEVEKLLVVTKRCLYNAISQAVAGNHLGDIGTAVQGCAEAHGYSVVKGLGGHGIGREMHEDPFIPNCGKHGRGLRLKEGMCIAIEPMIVMGKPDIGLLPDQWGIVTWDGKPAAHFEHTIVVRRGHAEILSTFEGIEIKKENIYVKTVCNRARRDSHRELV